MVLSRCSSLARSRSICVTALKDDDLRQSIIYVTQVCLALSVLSLMNTLVVPVQMNTVHGDLMFTNVLIHIQTLA